MSPRRHVQTKAPRPAISPLLGLAAIAFFGCATGSGGTLERTEEGFRLTESGRTPLGARAAFREANESLGANDLEAAIDGFEAASAEAPSRAAPRVNHGIALRRADRLEEAEQVLREAIELHPRHVVAHNELGLVYRRLGRLEEARRSYERALALYADFHFAHRNLGILCDLFLADTACALSHYRRYRALAPEDDQVAIWIADLEQRANLEEVRP